MFIYLFLISILSCSFRQTKGETAAHEALMKIDINRNPAEYHTSGARCLKQFLNGAKIVEESIGWPSPILIFNCHNYTMREYPAKYAFEVVDDLKDFDEEMSVGIKHQKSVKVIFENDTPNPVYPGILILKTNKHILDNDLGLLLPQMRRYYKDNGHFYDTFHNFWGDYRFIFYDPVNNKRFVCQTKFNANPNIEINLYKFHYDSERKTQFCTNIYF